MNPMTWPEFFAAYATYYINSYNASFIVTTDSLNTIKTYYRSYSKSPNSPAYKYLHQFRYIDLKQVEELSKKPQATTTVIINNYIDKFTQRLVEKTYKFVNEIDTLRNKDI